MYITCVHCIFSVFKMFGIKSLVQIIIHILLIGIFIMTILKFTLNLYFIGLNFPDDLVFKLKISFID